MNSNLRWKAIFVAAVILLCFYGLVGLPDFPTSLTTVKQNLSQRIRLGLDLQGGTHLVVQVQVHEAVRQETNQAVSQLYTLLRDKNIPSDQPIAISDSQIKVSNIAPERISDFRSLVSDSFQVWDAPVAAPGETNGYLLNLKSAEVTATEQRTMDQAVTTIRRRIDQLGLREPVVEPYGQGDNEIIVELAGEGDPTQAKAIISQGGALEVRLVEDTHPYSSQAEAQAAHNGLLPPNTELLPGKPSSAASSTAGAGDVWWLVSTTPAITGRDLRTARAQRSTQRPPYYDVAFNLTTEAGRNFGKFTEPNIGKSIATILDHKVELVATLNGKIEDQGVIEGTFTEQEATDLALVLEAGALPASITYLEERTVGPSLGADSIRHGIQASLTSLIVVLIFMVVYYRSAGVNAVIALLLNLLILLAALAYFTAVLTLPGIAGVILTIGMGVDSNVLIFERIREELRAGKSAVSAVDLGFKRAFLTIIDTHVTTVVSAFFLFLFGTGPIKGFAISLTIGLVANLFTSVYVSRMIFDWHLAKSTQQSELSI
jgi:preprotein translocase subunit SecD